LSSAQDTCTAYCLLTPFCGKTENGLKEGIASCAEHILKALRTGKKEKHSGAPSLQSF
jgi:hypothetical protein